MNGTGFGMERHIISGTKGGLTWGGQGKVPSEGV